MGSSARCGSAHVCGSSDGCRFYEGGFFESYGFYEEWYVLLLVVVLLCAAGIRLVCGRLDLHSVTRPPVPNLGYQYPQGVRTST